MDNNSVGKKALSGVIWKFSERILAQLVSVIVSIVIARILMPEDYSVVSVVTLFFSFANVLISGGFNSALIQKKNADSTDFSTVLVLSVGVSLGLYAAIFFFAPVIATAYGHKILTPVLRIMGLILPVNAIKGIWCAFVSSKLMFKKFFLATLGGTLISAVVGVTMALHGFGPWALVAQQMTNTVIDTLILIATTRIGIRIRISFDRLRGLFKYGWKVFVSSVIGVVYKDITPLIIGFKYTNADLAYYSKGQSFPQLVSSTTNATLSAVLFPVMAKYQDDKEAMLKGTRLFIQLTSFVSFPLMFGLFAVADNFVAVVLTEKWLPAVPYVRIFCISCMFDMIHSGNCEVIKAMGRSDIFLVMEVIKKSCYFIVIGLFVWLGNSPQVLACAFIICTLIATIVNSIPNKKLIDYKFVYQCQDLVPNLLTAIAMCVAVRFAGLIPGSSLLKLIVQIGTGMSFYIIVNILIHNASLAYLWRFAKGVLKKGEDIKKNR